MQAIAPVTTDQLLASGQEPKARVEIYNNGSWINLNNLHSGEGLVGWWAFDEGEGMVAYDHSKYGNHGSLENMAEEDWVDGVVGKCLDFDGVDDYVEVPDDAIFDTGGALSICAWIKANDVFNGDAIVVHDLSAYKWLLYATGATVSKVNFYIITASGESSTGNNTDDLNDGKWHFVVGVYDKTLGSDRLKLYIDGELDKTANGYNENITAGDEGIHIGSHYNALANGIPAKIDEVRIYNRALTASEVKALYELKGKNYLEDWSISLGGASMTPNPIGGTFNLTLFNEGSIFHPQHPTSAYTGYCVTGRKARISLGATYGGVDYYWQRIIGHMDEPKFSTPSYRVNITGGDYMKFLQDAEFQELDATYPNYWGTSATFDSWPSDGLVGAEIYAEGDAMDIAADANNIGTWTTNNCTFVSYDAGAGDPSQPSNFVGRLTASTGATSYINNADVGNVTINYRYKVAFQHRAVGEVADTEKILVRIYQGGVCIKSNTYYSSDTWKEDAIVFTATATAAVQMRINCPPTIADLRVDLFSIKRHVGYEDRYYELPAASKGAYHVTLNGTKVEQGEEDEGWYEETGTRRVFFTKGKTVADGSGTLNVEIFYFTVTEPEDAVARILYFGKVPDPATGVAYVNEAAAKAAMDNDDPGFTIDKVWFKAGSTFLNAIKMLAERCNYRFYFKYDGTPAFKAMPAPGVADFTFTSPKHLESYNKYQNRKEIKNRIIIKGIRQAELNTREEVAQSELTGEDHDDASIGAYGERTLTITNHLFQTQAPLDAMCATLLALYKDPKWYGDLNVPFNPVPLELVDDIQWEERLSHALDVTETGVIRDIKIDGFNTTYKCEKT